MSVFGLSSPNKQLVTEERMASIQESSFSLTSSRSTHTTPRLHRETTTTVHEEVNKKARTFTASTVTSNEISDALMDGAYSHAETDGDSNIDDTCFSTFSEVPNMDMTNFAALGKRSPTKSSIFGDQVRPQFFGIFTFNNSNHP
jgi:hypothetical protein